MKKIFAYMMMMVAVAMLTTSCSSDDDKSMTAEEAAAFLVNGNWQGYSIKQRKEWGSFIDQQDRTWNVLRFERATSNALNGTGRQLGFVNEYVNTNPEVSNFRWSIEGNTVTIAYEKWGSATFNFQEMTLNNDKFQGFIYERDDVRYEVNYHKDPFTNWDKY